MHAIATSMPVLVTASARGETLGRELAAGGVSLVGATGTLAQLRRSLVRGRVHGSVVLCITLDDPTFRRHGAAIAQILDDRRSFPTPIHAIGMFLDDAPVAGWQSLGCDAYTMQPARLGDLLEQFEAMASGIAGLPHGVTNRFSDQFASESPRSAEARHEDFRRRRSSSRRRH